MKLCTSNVFTMRFIQYQDVLYHFKRLIALHNFLAMMTNILVILSLLAILGIKLFPHCI